jgi:hypothetical protein
MLKFLRLGVATVVAVFSTQVTSSMLVTPANAANQLVQASRSKLVITDETPNARTGFTNANSILVADSTTNTPGVAEKVGQVGIMLGLLAVGGSAVGVILSGRKANNPFKLGSKPSPQSKENTIRLDQASRKLQKKLLRLLHDDQDTANRLLSQVKMKNPNRSSNWYVEKVIYDLERDRGA